MRFGRKDLGIETTCQVALVSRDLEMHTIRGESGVLLRRTAVSNRAQFIMYAWAMYHYTLPADDPTATI